MSIKIIIVYYELTAYAAGCQNYIELRVSNHN